MLCEVAEKLKEQGIRFKRDPRIGENYSTCPQCSHKRKKKTDECLCTKIEDDGATGTCHHCGWSFGFKAGKKEGKVFAMSKKPAKPVFKHGTLPEHIMAWFKARGISETTLVRNHIGYGKWYWSKERGEVDAILFPFFRCSEVINIKARELPKDFRQSPGAESIFYGLDDIADTDTAIIVEGEIDKMALEEAGFLNVISLPNGALKENKNGGGYEGKQTNFIGNSLPQLEHIKTFILAGDADSVGIASQEELARILGRDKCLRVTWPDSGDAPCKDANDVLIHHGKQVLRECIKLAAPYPIENLIDDESYSTEFLNFYRGNQQKALSVGWSCMDEYFKIREGELIVITGIPNSGKSEWIDAVAVNLAENHDWKFTVCSFENPPNEHIPKLLEKWLRKPCRPGITQRMTEQEGLNAIPWLREHFHFMRFHDATPTIDEILATARQTVLRYGINAVVIDPYNYLEHRRPERMSETEYVSQMLSQVKCFAQNHGVAVFFVAHPAKMYREGGKLPVPTLYDISGSANWVNKADIGIVVHRDQQPGSIVTEIWIRKIRHKSLGKQGMVKLNWDVVTGRYGDPEEVERAAREFQERRYGG